jgi:hypothetical protein
MGKKTRLKLGKRKQLRIEGWVSAFVKPCGRFWKRLASKQARRSGDELVHGAAHKKTWGPFEWS